MDATNSFVRAFRERFLYFRFVEDNLADAFDIVLMDHDPEDALIRRTINHLIPPLALFEASNLSRVRATGPEVSHHLASTIQKGIGNRGFIDYWDLSLIHNPDLL